MKLLEGVSIKAKDHLPFYNKKLFIANLFLQRKQVTKAQPLSLLLLLI
jgi:hypothetical protein